MFYHLCLLILHIKIQRSLLNFDLALLGMKELITVKKIDFWIKILVVTVTII